MLTALGIERCFGPTVALDGADFRALPGEIHALIGENGAGKSTLVNILAGRIRPDRGAVTLDNIELQMGSPAAALDAGIAAVHQSTTLFERMSWEDNLALGGSERQRRGLDRRQVVIRAGAIASRLGFELPAPGSAVERCSVSERVRLEIIRALSFEPRVLMLDEPTGVLAPGELAGFIEMLRRLRDEGRIVVIVTHKLDEALAVADRVTVLSRGRTVAETLASATDEVELARLMIGDLPSAAHRPHYQSAARVAVLAVDDLTLVRGGGPLLDRVSLRLYRSEIAGIAGVDGNGQRELAELMAGLYAPSSGAIRVDSGSAPLGRTRGLPLGAAGGAVVAVVPQDRDREGLIVEMPLWENLMLAGALRARFTGRRGWLRCGSAAAWCGEVMDQFAIRADSPRTVAGALSGGNRQRLTVARALAAAPEVLVAHDICRGLDLRATAELHRRLREFAAAGGAVLLISSDLDELFELCARLFVICRGRLTEMAPNERDPAQIGLLMAGGRR